MCRPLGVKTVMKTADTLRSQLVKVKQAMPSSKKKGVIYKIPRKDCPCVYIGETGRTLEKRLSEHKAAVKKNYDPKNSVIHAWANQHQVNWEAASVKQEERIYWRRRVLGALHIHQQHWTLNLDCGLNINATWFPPSWANLPPKVTPPDPPPMHPLTRTLHFILCNYSTYYSFTQL